MPEVTHDAETFGPWWLYEPTFLDAVPVAAEFGISPCLMFPHDRGGMDVLEYECAREQLWAIREGEA